jgi:hypothetical protein
VSWCSRGGNVNPRWQCARIRAVRTEERPEAVTSLPAGRRMRPSSEFIRSGSLNGYVLVDELDRDWWVPYREELEGKFHQQELVIRAHLIDRL